MPRSRDKTHKQKMVVKFSASGEMSVVKAFSDVDRAAQDSQQGLEGFRGGLLAIDAAMGIAARAASALQGAWNALKAPAQLAIDWERQFAKIRTLNSSLGVDLENQLLELAGRLPQTAGDIATSTYSAISAGIDPTQVAGFIEAASKAATAGGVTLSEATTALTKTLNGFKEQGLEAGRAMDVLFATVKRGDTDFAALAQSIGLVAPVAGGAGVAVEEMGAALATITKSAPNTSIAVTQLNAVLKLFKSPTDQTAKALGALGIQTDALTLKQVGLVGMLEQLQAATQGNVGLISTITRDFEAASGLSALLSNNLETLRGDLEATAESQGALAEASEIMGSTTQSAISQFSSTLEGAMREIGRQVLPELTTLLQAATDQISVNGPAIAKAVRFVADGVSALGSFVAEWGKPIATFFATSFAASKVTAVAAAIATRLTPALTMLTGTVGAAGFAISGLGGAITRALSLAGPIGLAVAGVGAIGVAIADSISDAAEERLQQRQADLSSSLSKMLDVFEGDLTARYGQTIKTVADLGKQEADLAAGQYAVILGERKTALQLIAEAGEDAARDIAAEEAHAAEERAKIHRQEIDELQASMNTRSELIEEALRESLALRSKAAAAGLRLERTSYDDRIDALREAQAEERAAIVKHRGEIHRIIESSQNFLSEVTDEVTTRRRDAQLLADQKAEVARIKGAEAAAAKARAAARAHARLLAKVQEQGERWRAEIIEDAEFRELELLRLKHEKQREELRRAGRRVADLESVLLTKQEQERQRVVAKFAEKRRKEAEGKGKKKGDGARLAFEQNLQDRIIDLTENEEERRLAAMALRQERELEMARQAGHNLVALREIQEKEMTRAIEQEQKKRREREARELEEWGDGMRQGGALTLSVMESIAAGAEAIGIQGDAAQKALAYTRGLVSAADAISYGAQSVGALGSFNFFSAAKYAAAALGAGAASVAYFKAADKPSTGAAPALGAGGGAGGVTAAANARGTEADLGRRGGDEGQRSITYQVNYNGPVFDTQESVDRAFAEGVRRQWRAPGGVKAIPPSDIRVAARV